MATQSTDFTRKLRAAVKAKLEEFGLDVDEELPDYVMIMVGNKKEKARMKSDLKLFLGDNTSPFVEWLFGFFQKVKSVTSSGEGSSVSAVVGSQNSAATTSKPSKSTEKSKAEPAVTVKSKHSSKKHSRNMTKESDNAGNVRKKKHDSLKQKNDTLSNISIEKPKESSKRQQVKSNHGTDIESKLSKKSHEHHERAEETSSELRHNQSTENSTRTLSVSNDHHHRNHEVTTNISRHVVKTKSVEEKQVEKCAVHRRSPEKQLKVPETTSQPAKASEESVLSVVKINNNNRQQQQPLRRAIVYGSNDSNDEVENDDSDVLQNRKVSSKVVVHQNVDPPSPKVNSKVVVLRRMNENQIKGNKGSSTIFKRAISEAASFSAGYGTLRNIASAEKERSDNKFNYSNEASKEAEKRVFKDKNDETMAGKKFMQRIIVTVNSNSMNNGDGGVPNKFPKIQLADQDESNNAKSDEVTNQLEMRVRKIPTKSSFLVGKSNENSPNDSPQKDINSSVALPQKRKRIVYQLEENNEQDLKNSLDDATDKKHRLSGSNIQNKFDEPEEEERNAVVSQIKQNKRQPDNLSRAFIRLSGINPKMMRMVKSVYDEAQVSNEYDHKDENFLEKPKRKMAKAGNTNKRTEKDKASLSPPAWNGQINLDVSSSDDEAEIDAVLATAQAVREATRKIEQFEMPPPTAALSRGVTNENSYSTLGYNPAQYQTPFVPPIRTENSKVNERCRFWPDCRNEDVCPFHHPTKTCTTFPNCWYGEKCLFIHPPCKFGMSCTKLKCMYTHYKVNPTTTVESLTALTTVAPASTPAISTTAPTTTTSTTTVVTTPILSNTTSATTSDATELVSPTIPLSTTTTTSASTIACRYGGRCQNLKCIYKHPPACRFGANCRNQGCFFSHRKGTAAPSLSKVYNIQNITKTVEPQQSSVSS